MRAGLPLDETLKAAELTRVPTNSVGRLAEGRFTEARNQLVNKRLRSCLLTPEAAKVISAPIYELKGKVICHSQVMG